MKSKRKAVSGLSPEAQAVWDELDEKTRSDLQKTNPYKLNRDRAIRGLIKGPGLRVKIVKELTGVSRSSIYRIASQGDYLPEYAREDVRDLIRAFKAFIKSLSVLLAGKSKKGGGQ